jgi:hypothetical protein
MTISLTDFYEPLNNGVMVASDVGIQKFPSDLSSFSAIFNDIAVSNSSSKYCIDSCWESNDIYYLNYINGLVKKVKFDRTEIASLALTNPYALSISQYSIQISQTIAETPQSDKGCWIIDKGSETIIRTDNNLSVLYVLSDVSYANCIVSDIDEGCYFSEQHISGLNLIGNIVKLSRDAQVLDLKNYASFSPVITHSVDKLVVDGDGVLWILANDIIYNVTFENNVLNQEFVLYPLLGLGKEYHVLSMDFDIRDGYLYVVAGNSTDSMVFKYDSDGNLVLTGSNDIPCPYIVKVVQGFNSSCFYALSDPSKWDPYISMITADIVTSGTFVWESYETVQVNGTEGYYIRIYTGDTTGLTPDNNRIFRGDELTGITVTASGYNSIVINGSVYYIPIFSGDIVASYKSNLFGYHDTTSTFYDYGYAILNVNGNKKFTKIYTT